MLSRLRRRNTSRVLVFAPEVVQTITALGRIDSDAMTDPDPDSDPSTDESDSALIEQRVGRSFTCSVCGYAMAHRTLRLRTEVHAICLNCGDWTVQTASVEELVDTARDVAERLAGTILTERQTLAYLLRELVGVDRQVAAEVMDTTPSNVDNLHRRGREKVIDARRIVEELTLLQADSGSITGEK